MALASERTAWAEGMGLSDEEVEALTLVSEEASRRLGDKRPELDPRDVDTWPAELEAAGLGDLAARVCEIRDGGAS